MTSNFLRAWASTTPYREIVSIKQRQTTGERFLNSLHENRENFEITIKKAAG
jgi:hypothetical protein